MRTDSQRLVDLQNDLRTHLVDMECVLIYYKGLLKSALDTGQAEQALFLNDLVNMWVCNLDELGYIADASNL